SGGGPAQGRLLGRSQRSAAPELTTRGRCRPYRGGDFRLEDRPPPPRSARVLPQQSRGRNPGLAGGTFPQPAVGGLVRDPLAPLGYSPSRAGGEIRDSPAVPSPNLRLGDYPGAALRGGVCRTG